MKYNFDDIHNRLDTRSAKYALQGKPEGTLPLWVADMDFTAPPAVLEALKNKVAHGIFGYSYTDDAYFEAVEQWMRIRHDWPVKKEWLFSAPGVVFTLGIVIKALTQIGDAVLIQQPVYYPFESMVERNGRKLVVDELVYTDGRYSIDFGSFEQQIIQNNVRLFILCSPHNPVGRVWTREELTQMGDICLKHGVIVVADEIHADFVYPGHTHHVFASLRKEYEPNTITCTAPSKTFNLAGLQVSNAFVPNKEYRQRMQQEMGRCGYGSLNILAIEACEAAYMHGADWLDQLLVYVEGNDRYVREFLANHAPSIQPAPLEGSYLQWLDCRALGLSVEALDKTMLQDARLWLNSGSTFGMGGDGFMRMNLACPRSILEQACERLLHTFG